MENTQPQTVEMIRKDAIIPIEIGAGFYARLQQLLAFMVEDKTEEQIKEMQQALNSNAVNVDSWHYHYNTTLSLCQALDKQAQELKLTVTVPMDSLFSQVDDQAN